MKKFFNKVSKKISELKTSSLDLCSRFNKFVRRVKLKDIYATAVQTLKDMRSPKELGVFISAVILPGGLPAYFGFKLAKHMNKKHVANDNVKGKKALVFKKAIKLNKKLINKPKF